MPGTMPLGAFSMSLAVADLAASRTFYEALGFEVTGGEADDGWLILVNGPAVIGLFHGIIEQNVLTFNPGTDPNLEPVEGFTDVREVQARLRSAGIELATETDPDGTGPAHIALVDPDGNHVLVDQFVDRPA